MLKRVLFAVFNAVLVCAVVAVVSYIRMVVIGGGTFVPNWFEYIFLAIVAGVATFFAPDREQRRKNREELKNKFKHDDDDSNE